MLEHKYISSYTNDTDTCSKSVLQSLRQQLPQVANEICLKINMFNDFRMASGNDQLAVTGL
jgi:hypothetical protein